MNEQLAKLKDAVRDRASAAPDLNALRLVLRQLFESFNLTRMGESVLSPDWQSPYADGHPLVNPVWADARHTQRQGWPRYLPWPRFRPEALAEGLPDKKVPFRCSRYPPNPLKTQRALWMQKAVRTHRRPDGRRVFKASVAG